jgi:hypothetical protein
MQNLIKNNSNIIRNQYYEILPFDNGKKTLNLPKFDLNDAINLGVATVELAANLTILTGLLTVKCVGFLVKIALTELQKEPKKLTNSGNIAEPQKLTKVVTTTTTVTEITYL